MDYKTRFGVTMATGWLMFSALLPGAVLADTTVDISGNGNNSNNTVNVSNNQTTNVLQENILEAGIFVISVASTGNNTANNNTGGNVTINTGSATSNVSTIVTGGNNTANITGCGCANTTDNVTISGNGNGSDSTVNITNKKVKNVGQGTYTGALVGVGSFAKTGKNKAKNNTGGNTNITTGNASSNVSTNVTGGSNTLNVTP